MKSVYLETTIPSFATGRLSRDMIIAGRQAATMVFWENERHKYDLFISQYVLDECAAGDSEAAKRRIDFLKGILVLPKSDEVSELANVYQHLLNIPDKAKIDCFHLAICVIGELDYLMSWNCVHLGIGTFIKIRDYNEKRGLWTPLLTTPETLIDIGEGE